MAPGRELTCHRLHAVGAAAGHDDHAGGVVDLLQRGRDVAHDLLEALRHVVQGAVGEHDRVLEQTVRINVGRNF
jgi:hypothetical protein